MTQDPLNLVRLLDLDADADRVDARLDQDPLVLVACDRQGRQENLGRGLGFDLGDIVSLGGLRRKVGEGECCGEGAAYSLKVRTERLGLRTYVLAAAAAAGRAVDGQAMRGNDG